MGSLRDMDFAVVLLNKQIVESMSDGVKPSHLYQVAFEIGLLFHDTIRKKLEFAKGVARSRLLCYGLFAAMAVTTPAAFLNAFTVLGSHLLCSLGAKVSYCAAKYLFNWNTKDLDNEAIAFVGKLGPDIINGGIEYLEGQLKPNLKCLKDLDAAFQQIADKVPDPSWVNRARSIALRIINSSAIDSQGNNLQQLDPESAYFSDLLRHLIFFRDHYAQFKSPKNLN